MSRDHKTWTLGIYETLLADKSHTYLHLGYEILSLLNSYKHGDLGRCMIFQGPIQKRNAFEQSTDFYSLTCNAGTFKDSKLYYFNKCIAHLHYFLL
jgi:hypothetical protein